MRVTTRLVALGTAGLLALTACGGSGKSPGSGSASDDIKTGNSGNTGQAQDPTRKGPVTIDGAEKGGVVKLVSISGLNTMDPSEAYYTNTSAILSGLVTRSLTQYVYDPDTNSVTLVPDLATDLGQHNADYTEWKYTIRDGIKYENGDPVTAEDVKFGMERTMDVATFPESPGGYSLQYFDGAADYKGPYTGKGATLDSISVDGMTITIKMSQPFADMPYWGAFPANGPVPQDKAVSDPAKYRLHPWATGPYMFDKYTPEKSLTLVRNPNWDPATDPGRTAYPDGYEFTFDMASEKIDQLMLGDQGDAQVTASYDDVLAPDYAKMKETGRLVLGTSPCTYYWAPDYRKITDIKVRQALAWAYPYKAATKAAGLVEGVTRIYGSELLPPGTPGRVEYNALEGHELGQTDPAKAKALLKEAGAEGFEIKWLFATDDPNSVAAKDAVAAGLKAAGFTPKPVPTTVAELSTIRVDPDAPINVRTGGWCADWPSGGSWFPVLLKSPTDIKANGIGQNLAVFGEADVDQKIADIQAAPIEEQSAKWGELDKYIAETYFPLFVTGYTGVAQMHGSKVNGFYDDLVFGMPTFKNMWLTQ